MPTDSWGKYKHLFVDDFKPTEWNSINEFYDICQLFDEAIKHNDNRFAEQENEVRHNVHQATYKYAVVAGEKLVSAQTDEEKQQIVEDFFKKRNSVVDILGDARYIHIYTANKQNGIVKKCLENVNTSLSLTVVGTKLEKLSKNKFWAL